MHHAATQKEGMTQMTVAPYANTAPLCKPSIVAVVENYLELRRAGKELSGRCPFHADKTPSFFVSEEKGLFYCFGCQESGDVIDFVELIENITFKEACARLQLDTFKPKPRPHRAEAEKIVGWARQVSARICSVMREIGAEIHICSVARKQPDTDKEFICTVEAELVRQWAILEDLDDDINNPNLVVELYRQRIDIERLLDLAELG